MNIFDSEIVRAACFEYDIGIRTGSENINKNIQEERIYEFECIFASEWTVCSTGEC